MLLCMVAYSIAFRSGLLVVESMSGLHAGALGLGNGNEAKLGSDAEGFRKRRV